MAKKKKNRPVKRPNGLKKQRLKMQSNWHIKL
jgi:hypothetical protein